MRCCVMLCAAIVLHSVGAENLTSDSIEATETQRATCQIVTDKLVATASATVSRALKGVCSNKELDKHVQTIRHELSSQINKIHTILLKMNQKLANLQEIVDQKSQQDNTSAKNVQKIGPRDLEFKVNNYTVHEDNITKKRVFSYYWKIEGIKDKLTMNNKQLASLSPTFYVNEGYRMYIKMFPDQDKGNVYIHVGLTNGVNDDQMDWPFKLKHRVTIVDQSPDGAEDIMSQLWDPTILCSSSDWDKPSRAKNNEECVGFGFTQDTLFHNSYIFNNTLVIKLDVIV